MSSPTLRLLKLLGESGFWRQAGRLHTWVYRQSGGTLGRQAGRISNLLLTTTGRKSGARRTVPLAHLADGDAYVVDAANGGADRHPAWWFNLQQHPPATVELGDRP